VSARKRQDGGYLGLRRWLAQLIRRRFGGYTHQLFEVDENLPLRARGTDSGAPRVAILGAGIAGMGAACDLAERGFDVTLLEKNPYLGGKVGAWCETAADGTRLEVEHGFHAFFRHYYNLNGLLERTAVSPSLKAVDDYLILDAHGTAWSFRDVERTPALNLLSLSRRGLYRLRDILFTARVHEMDVFLAYERESIFNELDHVSYEDFARRLALPDKLKLVFSTFARSFFAQDSRLSSAELIKSFHFYYLSHDHGLIYDYPDGSYQKTLLEPLRAYMEARQVRIRLGNACRVIAPRAGGGYVVDDLPFDYVVLATDAGAARAILESSPALRAALPALLGRLSALKSDQRYAVWRIWIDQDVRSGLPVFVSTERLTILDSVTLHHRIVPTSAFGEQAERVRAVLELHCYALPDALDEQAIRAAFVHELLHYFPELSGFNICQEVLQVRADFSAFHVNMAAQRPGTESGLDGLYLAGDWVRLPCPAMLMEAAYTASLLATNAILEREGLRPYPVLSVPTQGLLFELRQKKLRARAARSGTRRLGSPTPKTDGPAGAGH
jgi:isorenieratene synthase